MYEGRRQYKTVFFPQKRLKIVNIISCPILKGYFSKYTVICKFAKISTIMFYLTKCDHLFKFNQNNQRIYHSNLSIFTSPKLNCMNSTAF